MPDLSHQLPLHWEDREHPQQELKAYLHDLFESKLHGLTRMAATESHNLEDHRPSTTCPAIRGGSNKQAYW